MNAQTNTTDAKFQVGDLVEWELDGDQVQGTIGRLVVDRATPFAEVLVEDTIHCPDLAELILIERKKPTDAKFQVGDLVTFVVGGLPMNGVIGWIGSGSARCDSPTGCYYVEHGKYTRLDQNQEPTHEGGKERTAAAGGTSWAFRVGDRVSWTGGVGKVIHLNELLLRVEHDDGERYWLAKSEATLVEDAPAAVVAAVNDATPLQMSDEPIDLGDVDADDRLIAASLDAVTLLVRIAAADNLPVRERVTLNGVTWLVDVRPE